MFYQLSIILILILTMTPDIFYTKKSKNYETFLSAHFCYENLSWFDKTNAMNFYACWAPIFYNTKKNAFLSI